jgi:hypothetical protein
MTTIDAKNLVFVNQRTDEIFFLKYEQFYLLQDKISQRK